MNSASGGDIIFHFKGNDSDLKKTTGNIQGMTKSLLVATGITKAVSAGFNMITNSTDAAISRLDTLNNFPKVMSNLGIGADEAQKSIDKMSDKLAGLPTTLDQGAMAVQRFTSANGDVKKSTDIFLALNNAILAGGASSEIQASALEQLSQAYAKGKPDMMEWRTAMTAMPAQLKQVANAMGYVSADELGASLRDGSVSMDQFMDTISKLNEKGVQGFQSFEEQARNSTGGIRTSITVMKTRVAQGVTEMIKSLSESMEQNGMGNLGEMFVTVGDSIKKSLVSLAPHISKIIGFLSKLFQWIDKNKAILGAILIPIGAFITILNVWQNTVALVTAAQTALNLVMAINPFVLIIAAIIALVALFAYLWNTCEGFRNFWIGLWEGIKSAFQAVIDGIVSIFTGIIDFFANNWTTLLLFLVNPFIGAFKLLYDKCESFRNFVNGFVQAVIGFFQRLPGNIKQIATTIVNTIKSIPGKVVSIGLDIVKGIGNGITSGVSWIKKRIKEFVGNVTSFIKKVFKIGSPSKLMSDQVGQWIPKGIAVGIDANTDSVYDSMKEMQDSISGNFGLSPQLANSLHYSPSVNVVNNVDVSTDPLGQTVNKIKTFSGGAKNDYNYGMGV